MDDINAGLNLPRRAAPTAARHVRTANRGLHAISLLTKERVQRFARQQCDRAQAEFVENAKAFGKIAKEYVQASDQELLRVARGQNHAMPSRQAAMTCLMNGNRADARLAAMGTALFAALRAAERVAGAAMRMGDTGRMMALRNQVAVLCYSVATTGGKTGALYERANNVLTRIEKTMDRREHASVRRDAGMEH